MARKKSQTQNTGQRTEFNRAPRESIEGYDFVLLFRMDTRKCASAYNNNDNMKSNNCQQNEIMLRPRSSPDTQQSTQREYHHTSSTYLSQKPIVNINIARIYKIKARAPIIVLVGCPNCCVPACVLRVTKLNLTLEHYRHIVCETTSFVFIFLPKHSLYVYHLYVFLSTKESARVERVTKIARILRRTKKLLYYYYSLDRRQTRSIVIL